MGCSYANSAYLAYPIVLQLLGPVAGRVLALCSLVENILMMPLTLAIADSASATHEPFVRALGRSLARLRHNPIIIGIVLGAACASLRLPEALERAVELVAACSAPLALFTVGGNLVGLALGELLLDAQAISFTKLLLHPLAVAALMLTIGPADPALRMGAVITASAPMLTIYPIFGARHGLQGLCAAALLLATTLSFVTLSTWVWLISAGGPLSALFH
jgi:predicted permease